MAGAGDLDAGRAWRTVRRPSDMVRSVAFDSETSLTDMERNRTSTRSKLRSTVLKTMANRMARSSSKVYLLPSSWFFDC